MKKIVFFNSTMQMGGPARVISLWSNYFINQSIDVEIVSNIDVPLFYKFDENIKYSILGIDKFKQKSKIKTLFSIYSFLKNRENEILVFNKGLYIIYLFFLKKMGLINKSLKLVYFAHGGSSDFKTMYNNGINYMINFTFDRVITLHDDYDTFDYKESKKRKMINSLFLNKWEDLKNKITYIPNPVTFRSEQGVDYENRVILAVGRLDKIKGFNLLIESWQSIAKKYPNWKLKIVGSGEEEKYLKYLAKGIENIEFLSEQKNIKREYLSSSIYAMPSIEEGFGMVVVEAMECGLPIVAFDNVGAKFLVKDNGLLCKIKNIICLSESMEKLILDKNLRETLGKKSKEEVKQFYIENLSSKWKEIFND